MASGKYNTMAEGLQKIAQDITLLFATPDADLEWLAEFQSMALQKMRQPFDAVAQQQGQPPAGNGPGQMPPEIAAMMGGQGPAQGVMPAPAPGGMPGGPMPGPGAPNPDELRRLMDAGL